ncbi:bola-like protein [Calocera viscosa TUFC12733]|uniref:Bola-like protein n=1 Tax=Calocera viscosa (strain TUFC12733) TaxID=1330018 RepID=A0A167MBZ6_CALVF|nr:bola-like protein [Calocera viscosa TUFC12733]
MATQAQKVSSGPVEQSIRSKLTALLSPTALDIQNDSWKHRHHAPMREIGGGDGETHFAVQVVSPEFEGKNTMARHRMIYAALSEEMQEGLHALSLTTRTPKEMEKLAAQAEAEVPAA